MRAQRYKVLNMSFLLFGGSPHYMPQFIYVVLTRIALGTNFANQLFRDWLNEANLAHRGMNDGSSGNLVEE